MKKTIRTVKYNEWTYKLVNESYRDDYDSYQPDYVVYARYKKDGYQRITPATYSLSQGDAEGYMPHETKTCPTCGHSVTNSIYEKPKAKKRKTATKAKTRKGL